MNIDGLQELITNRPTSTAKPDPAPVGACKNDWHSQTLCQVNNSVVRLGVMRGEYRWHKHDNADEFVFVLEGEFLVDLPDRTVTLRPREGFVVLRGLEHRTRAPQRAVILMVGGPRAYDGNDMIAERRATRVARSM